WHFFHLTISKNRFLDNFFSFTCNLFRPRVITGQKSQQVRKSAVITTGPVDDLATDQTEALNADYTGMINELRLRLPSLTSSDEMTALAAEISGRRRHLFDLEEEQQRRMIQLAQRERQQIQKETELLASECQEQMEKREELEKCVVMAYLKVARNSGKHLISYLDSYKVYTKKIWVFTNLPRKDCCEDFYFIWKYIMKRLVGNSHQKMPADCYCTVAI
ncbi:unnamed protein product, partial [Protopolystoma xenopodis]